MQQGKRFSVRQVLLAVALPVAALTLLAWMALRDARRAAAAEDWADLKVARKVLPDDRNFRVALEEALALLPPAASVTGWASVTRRAGLGEWDESAVAPVLELSAAARARVKAALAACQGYAGRDERPEVFGYATPGFQALGAAHRLAFEAALRAGDVASAYGLSLELLQGLALLLDVPNDTRDLSCVLVWTGHALSASEKLLHHPACQDGWLAEMDRRLPRQEAVTRAGVLALKGDFWYTLESLADGSAMDRCFCVGVVPSSPPLYLLRKNYRPRQTRRLVAEGYRSFVAALDAGRVDETFFSAAFEDVSGLSALASFVRPNAGGRYLAEYLFIVPRVIHVTGVKQAENGAACLRALVACERYRRRRGAYPETLDALVPEYLAAVPRDTYCGEPLHYSRERELVWAAGTNARDDGGSTLKADGKDGGYRTGGCRAALDMVFPVSSNRYEAARESLRQREAARQARSKTSAWK